jgi:RNA polymerase sigma-70 factor (ECF subfamily)
MAERPAPQAAAKDGEPAPERGMTELAALVVAHHAAVYRYAHRLCGCPIEAEDLTQQTFLIAQQKFDQLREPDRACSWLLAVVRSCFLKSIRKTRPLPIANFDTLVEHVAVRTPTVEEIDHDQLAAALAELPEEFRLVVVMFYFEELSYQEIAEELEIPVGTVMSRLSRGKSHLRRRLAPLQDEPSAVSAPRGMPTPKVSKPSARGAAT